MTLTDTGPLVALVNGNDTKHAACQQVLPRVRVPLLTTGPCFTEAMYLLGKVLGYAGQQELWSYVTDGLLVLYTPSDTEWERMRRLMHTYRDAPMDLADASVVAAAETLSVRRVFTLDRHFYAYRTQDGQALEVVP